MWRISMTKKNCGLIFVSNLFLQIFRLFAFFAIFVVIKYFPFEYQQIE